MIPVFILAPPRTRTAWLATYLTGAGLYCFHEAWAQVQTVQGLRKMMASKGDGLVGNSDCGNWLFLDDLQHEFPEAKYVQITRTGDLEQAWTEAFGMQDWTRLRAFYGACTPPPLVASIDFHAWTPDVSLALWDVLTEGMPMDLDWHRLMHRLDVHLLPSAIVEQQHAARAGQYAHAVDRLSLIRST